MRLAYISSWLLAAFVTTAFGQGIPPIVGDSTTTIATVTTVTKPSVVFNSIIRTTTTTSSNFRIITLTVTSTVQTTVTTIISGGSARRRRFINRPETGDDELLRRALVTSTRTVTVTSGAVTVPSTTTIIINRTFGSVALAFVTVTATKIVRQADPGFAATTCNNGGLEAAIYANIYPFTAGYTVFQPAPYKTLRPSASTTIASIGYSGAASVKPYGLTMPAAGFYVLNHRGYFYAPRDGSYTFTLANGDNWAGLWLQEKAFSSWTKANADALAILGGSPGTGFKKLDLLAGSYTPFRVVYANGGGPGFLTLNVVDSTGKVYVNRTSNSPYLVRHPCDPASGKAFLNPFGAEAVVAPDSSMPDLTCGLNGVDVAIYDDDYTPTSGATFPAERWKRRQPSGTAVTNRMGFAWNANIWNKPYGLTPARQSPVLSYILNYRGYFFAPKQATYNFTLWNSDDWAGIWLGDRAISGWTGANADAAVAFSQPADSAFAELEEGQYYPFRVMVGSSGGAVQFSMEISDDAGAFYLRTDTPSPYIARGACPVANLNQKFRDPFGEER